MNKQDIIKRITRETGISRENIEKILNSILDNIKMSISDGENVSLVGFGIFKMTVRRQRKSCHPKTGKHMIIPSRLGLKFMPGIELKAAIAKCNQMRASGGLANSNL